jgi:hypothetical protein
VTAPRSLDLYWNPKQSAFLVSTDPFVDLEGGIRAGKSFALCWKILFACLDYPGIICALTRWTQDGLDAQLKPAWRDVCRMAGVTPIWNPTEEYDEIPGTGARVYLRALKAAEDTNRYGKLAGLEFTIIGIDQAEELPEDVFRAYVPGRLSQRFAPDKVTPVLHREHKTPPPKQVLITPNPPANTDHWICKDWPVDESTGANGDDAQANVAPLLKPGHLLIRTTMYDNAVLGADYIACRNPPTRKAHRNIGGSFSASVGLRLAAIPSSAASSTKRCMCGHCNSVVICSSTNPLISERGGHV